MIAMLRGTVLSQFESSLILDVHGVGYKVVGTPQVLQGATVGSEQTIYTYTHVREDLLELYGFANQLDLRLFEQLITVSGVGPKTALGVFAVGSASEIVQAIQADDVSFFSSVPRLGKKNAQKIIIELKSKVGKGDAAVFDSSDQGVHNEVLLALETFGFSRDEARSALRLITTDGKPTAAIVKEALRHLGR